MIVEGGAEVVGGVAVYAGGAVVDWAVAVARTVAAKRMRRIVILRVRMLLLMLLL